jgi:hypothetical protein
MPWDFSFYDEVDKTIHKHLETADYSIEGMENVVVIERKRNSGEIGHNIGLEKTRFENELDRMSTIRYSHLVCEFSIEDILIYPKNSGIPQHKWKYLRVNGKFILKTLSEYESKYGIQVHYCGNAEAACAKAVELFNYAYKMVN